MSKGGSQPAGNTTVTQTNPTQQAQVPFLQNLWSNAQGISSQEYNNPGFGQMMGNLENFGLGAGSSISPSTPLFSDTFNGVDNLINGGNPASGAINNINGVASSLPGQVNPEIAGMNGNANLVSGWAPGALSNLLGLSSGALGSTQGYAGGIAGMVPGAVNSANPAEQQLMANSGMAVGGNPALAPNEWMSSGALLSPNSNPYLAGTFSAAAQPVTNAFMTSTAPMIDSQMEAAGRYGSGANSNAQSVAQQNLGTTLDNLASNIYGNAYGQGLGATTTAAGNLGSQYNTGVFNSNYGAGQAGSLAQGGYSLGGNLLGSAGNLSNSGYSTAGSLAGTGYGTGLNLAGEGGTLFGNAGSLGLNTESELGSLFGNAGSLGISGLSPELQALSMSPGLASLPGTLATEGLTAPQIPNQINGGILGNPTSGSLSTTSPYFENGTANLLGGLTGGLGLLNGVNSAFSSGGALSGLGGLFGGSTAANTALDAATLAGAGGGAVDLGTLGAAAGGGGGLFSGLGALLGGLF
jgi:hypothetical protein